VQHDRRTLSSCNCSEPSRPPNGTKTSTVRAAGLAMLEMRIEGQPSQRSRVGGCSSGTRLTFRGTSKHTGYLAPRPFKTLLPGCGSSICSIADFSSGRRDWWLPIEPKRPCRCGGQATTAEVCRSLGVGDARVRRLFLQHFETKRGRKATAGAKPTSSPGQGGGGERAERGLVARHQANEPCHWAEPATPPTGSQWPGPRDSQR